MPGKDLRALLRNTLAIVLSGGQGERLHPLTRDRAKPAVPFGGIYRIIDFTLSNCVNSNMRRIYVLTQYKSISLQKHLRLGWNIFNDELGEFIYTIPPQQRTTQSWYRGTADAIYQNIYTLEQERPERVLILAGDHIYKMDYSHMLEFHEEKGADLTVGAVEFEATKTKDFGVIQIDQDSRIIGFQEKPEDPKTIPGKPTHALVSMGIYVFETPVLARAVIEDAKVDSTHDFGRDILPTMIDTSTVFAYNFIDENKKETKYWRDIGKIDAYWEANMDLVEVTPLFNLYDEDWPIRTYQEQYPPAKTVFSSYGENRVGLALDSIISGGCIISGGTVERSVLSHGVKVHSYSHVFESILLEGVDIGRGARIKRAIIDKDVRIPQGCEIGYCLEEDRKRFTVTEEGITVVPKGIPIE